MRRTLLSLPFVLAACGGTSPTTPDAGAPPVDVPAVATDTSVADVAAAQGDVMTTPDTPNWAEHVAPILYGQCVSCHRAGGIAPFPLVTYAQSVEMAASIVAETRARRMPPTVVNATGSCNEYRDDVRRLTDAQIETLRRWNETGRTQGDLARAPQMPPDPPARPPGVSSDTRPLASVLLAPEEMVTSPPTPFVEAPPATTASAPRSMTDAPATKATEPARPASASPERDRMVHSADPRLVCWPVRALPRG